MLAQVARDGARISIIAAAGRAADDDADRFAPVIRLLGKTACDE